MLSLLLAALLSSNGSGKTLVRAQPGTLVPSSGSNVLARFDFATPGCYPTGSAMGTKGQTITVSRSGTRTCNTGTIVTCQANEACVESAGLLVEPGRTNYVLNSATHPKAAESTGSLSTGAHVAWHSGADPMTVTTGTAVVTGLSCSSVAVGTVCPFTVTSAGTMLITTSAGATHAQIENGTYRTSQIPTAGTSAARAADSISIANPLAATNPASWCVEGTYTPESGAAWNQGTTTRGMWTLGTLLPNSAYASHLNGNTYLGILNASSTQQYYNAGALSAGGHAFRWQWNNAASSGFVSVDGAEFATPTGGPLSMSTMQATMHLGLRAYDAGSQFGGYIQNFKVSKGLCR